MCEEAEITYVTASFCLCMKECFLNAMHIIAQSSEINGKDKSVHNISGMIKISELYNNYCLAEEFKVQYEKD